MQLTEALPSSRSRGGRRQDVGHAQRFPLRPPDGRKPPHRRRARNRRVRPCGLGWDQPARLFALVDTAKLRAQEPGLAAQLGLDSPESTTAALTPIEQEEIPRGKALDEFLATIAWPDAVAGCAMTVERLMLPPSAEASVPDGLSDAQLTKWVARHPDRQEVRMTVAVLRNGARESAVRLREKDSPSEVLTGAGLVPGLAEALAATFES